jgi:hypothetical protein
MAAAARRVLVALDFDGVLVDSAAETALSGFAAAKALWPGAAWLTRRLRRPDQLAALVSNFEQIRPCLETGWESSILLHLLAEGMPNEDIMANFQSGLRDETMAKLNVTKETCNDALKQAREEWIGEDGTSDDWLAAHGFYDGACQSVRDLLSAGRVEDVYVITTKAADFSKRLLQKQQLFGEGAVGGGIKPEHIYVSDLVLCRSFAAQRWPVWTHGLCTAVVLTGTWQRSKAGGAWQAACRSGRGRGGGIRGGPPAYAGQDHDRPDAEEQSTSRARWLGLQHRRATGIGSV